MIEDILHKIASSSIFDSAYYLNRYEDIKRRNSEPLRHYLKYGHKEGRNPNAFFDTKFYRDKYLKGNKEINPLYHYLSSNSYFSCKTSNFFDGDYYLKRYPDVLKSGMNPLVHFLNFGLSEGRQGVETINHTRGSSSIAGPCVDYPIDLSVTIIVPVYNAIKETINCVDSIIRHTPLSERCRLLIINDSSPDVNVKKTIALYAKHPFISVVNNFRNLGYTRTVNKGIKKSGHSDVILLNSDTIVTPNWFTKMVVAAYSNSKIGTVTAVSNGAGSFSVPNSGYNETPNHLEPESISRILSPFVQTYVDVPTGNGFCFFIKRDVINSIGGFDENKFPRGYGEENDFCMRAIENGWNNIVSLGNYIYHKRSASFKDSKEKLIKSGINQVQSNFPQYEGAIRAIGASPIFQETRKSIAKELDANLASSRSAKPKLMFVISTRSGGTPQTNLDLMTGLRDIYDCYALACNSKTIEILIAERGGYKAIETIELKQSVKFATHRSIDYEITVKNLLFKYQIELLHIRHLAWHSLKLPQIAKELFIPVVMSFHDFYCMCPTVNLIDNKGEYNPNGVAQNGDNPLWSDETVKPINEALLSEWQRRMNRSLSFCDYFITTSQSTKDILTKMLHKVNKSKNFTVIPHGRDFETFVRPNFDDEKQKSGPLRVLLPGNITASKGAGLIISIKSLDLKNEIEFHVLGTCLDELKPIVKYHGKYQRTEFQKKVNAIKPDIAAVFSIWPETYCHTLTESWASGLPVLGLSYGAVEERIEQHRAGWLTKNDANQCFQMLIKLKNNREEINKAKTKVLEWQEGFGAKNTVSKMTSNYALIYQNLMSPPFDVQNKKLGLVMKGAYPEVPPTAYVRVVDWKDEFEAEFGVEAQFTHWTSLLTSSIAQFERFIIQRDAIPKYAVEWCINILKARDIPYIYEIDDDLINVPLSIDTNGEYKDYQEAFRLLITNAEKLYVTNESLKESLRGFNNNIFVRPNKIFEERWLNKSGEHISISKNGEDFSILYYGSRTHQNDLEFLVNVIEKLRKKGYLIQLYIVGCGDSDSEFVTRLIPPSSRYDLFVEWLVKISSNFDLGAVPLLEDEFSVNKSYLKVIEMKKLNLEAICSDILPYSELKGNIDGVTFVNNSEIEWEDALINVIQKRSAQ